MDEKTFDLIVIGSGPGGYVASIRASQLGFKTACVEKSDSFGGTCLNYGCIPSKALLHASECFFNAKNHFADYGIETDPKLHLDTMMQKKDQSVKSLTDGIAMLFKKNKITSLKGIGRIVSPNTVEVSGALYHTDRILIATGSACAVLKDVAIDENIIVSSTGALSFSSVPSTLAVIGGGVIGLELGSIWSRLGSQVTILEYGSRILPSMDSELSKCAAKFLKNQGLDIHTNTQVLSSSLEKTKATLEFSLRDSEKKITDTFDKVLVAIGRVPFTDNLGLDSIKVRCNANGFIEVNEKFETSVSGIYAIGDCIPGAMLAHRAEHDAIACVDMMAGLNSYYRSDTIPSVVYTFPEIASVGSTEEELKNSGIEYRVGKFPLIANSRAKAIDHTEGFVKLLTDAHTDRILGGHIIAPSAGEMIHEIVTVMDFGGSSEDIALICHAHPTYSEAIKEAALSSGPHGPINM